MEYDFSSLSHEEFEALAGDLIGEALGIRFEAFSSGPDGGIDGRYLSVDEKILLQVKHYRKSSFSKLKNELRKEKHLINSVECTRYIIATSNSISPQNKRSLINELGPEKVAEKDIFGPGDLNRLLRIYPEVQKAHPALWIHSEPMLESVLEKTIHRQPELILSKRRTAANDDRVRFYFGARRTRFLGRQTELDKVRRLLDDVATPFRWHLLSGNGGVGKSRLALELALEVGESWHAGFLDERAAHPDWKKWQPSQPTLIIVDYAAFNLQQTSDLIFALATRGTEDGLAPLSRPVRVLLIERAQRGNWVSEMLGNGSEWSFARKSRMLPDTDLKTVDDIWEIIESTISQENGPLPDRDTTLAALEKIDPQKTPLFALLLGDAISAGTSLENLDAEDLVRDVLQRERTRHWKQLGSSQREENLLALATICRGLSVEEVRNLETLGGLFPVWDPTNHPKLFKAMAAMSSPNFIAPLEPDIIGAHFVRFTLEHEHLSSLDSQRIANASWKIRPLGVAAFLLGLSTEMHNCRMAEVLGQRPPEETGGNGWWALQSYAVGTNVSKIALDDLQELVKAEPETSFLREVWAQMALHFVAQNPEEKEIAKVVVSDLNVLAGEYPHEEKIHESLASAIERNLENSLSGGGEDLAHVAELQSRFPESPVIREAHVRILVNTIATIAAADLSEGLSMVAGAKQNAAGAPEEPVLREGWSRAAANLAPFLSESLPVESFNLVNELYDEMITHPFEHVLEVEWARAIVNAINGIATWSIDRGLELVSQLKTASGEDRIMLQYWAKSIVGIIGPLATMNFGLARGLVGGLAKEMDRSNDADLREFWSQSMLNFINSGRVPLDYTKLQLRKMLRLAEEFSDEINLRIYWSRAMFFVANLVRGSNPSFSDRLIGQMSKFSTIETRQDIKDLLIRILKKKLAEGEGLESPELFEA